MNESILVNGKVIKSRNQYYNNEKARLYSIYDRQNGDTRHRNGRKLRQLSKKRSNRMNNYMHHCSRYVVNYCRAHSVGTIVIGKNDGWKQKSSLERKVNQKFVSIPYNTFINILRYKCKEEGIELIETEESNTSRCSYIDRDDMISGKTTGKRVSRGLYQNRDGTIINADINGAANIIRKVNEEISIPLESLQKVKRINVAW